MDVVFNYLSDFAYDTETYEVESMEEHLISSQCALNFAMNTLATGTSTVNSMEDEPNPPIEDVLSFGMDDLSYYFIQDGVDQENELNFSVKENSKVSPFHVCFWLKGSSCKTRKIF